MIGEHLAARLEELQQRTFTGNVTLHYLNGIPKKIRVEEIQDLVASARGPTRLVRL